MVSEVREYAGRHEYDGVVPDLSPGAVKARLAALGQGPPDPDPYDEAVLSAFEAGLRVEYGEAELHRRSPMTLLSELDLSSYDRDYAPAAERAAARRRHLAAWPDAIDAGLESLDMVSAPVAGALLAAVEGLTAGVGEIPAPARAAHARFVTRVREAAETGDPDPALGGPLLARLLGVREALEVDLGRLEELADAERDRLRAWLADACARIAPGRAIGEVVAGLVADHPEAHGVMEACRALSGEVIAFTRASGLVPGLDGECEVAEAPLSRRWVMAMISWAAPYEADAPSRFYVTPPDPPGQRPSRRPGWRCSTGPLSRPSRCTRSRPATSPTAGCCAGSAVTCAAPSSRGRSSRAMPTTPRRRPSRPGSGPVTPGSRRAWRSNRSSG